MGAFFSFLFAAIATVVAIVFGLATADNPYNDITRAYTSGVAALSGLFAFGLWVLGAVLVGRPGEARPEDDDWRRPPGL